VPRPLEAHEVEALLALAIPIHLATIDANGVPHITPLWFEWADAAFWMTSLQHQPHVRRLQANRVAAVCLDIEQPERADGERPNQQVRASGSVELLADADGVRTARITAKYLSGPGRDAMIGRRTSRPRIVVRLVPDEILAIASV
jgi:nitroimidazol reductase NimA-like FMN-containing flavoprotein (pyridoxamine 5'-phosphate oxidase superfamily)